MHRLLEPDEIDQLKLLAWYLLIINLIIVGVGVLLGRRLEDPGSAAFMIAAVALLIDGAFALVVGGNLLVVLAKRRPSRR
jgi:hypothetical protein